MFMYLVCFIWDNWSAISPPPNTPFANPIAHTVFNDLHHAVLTPHNRQQKVSINPLVKCFRQQVGKQRRPRRTEYRVDAAIIRDRVMVAVTG